MVDLRRLTERARHAIARRDGADRNRPATAESRGAVRESGTTTDHLRDAASSLRESGGSPSSRRPRE